MVWPIRGFLLSFEWLFLQTVILVLLAFLYQNHCATKKCSDAKLPQVKQTAFMCSQCLGHFMSAAGKSVFCPKTPKIKSSICTD